MMNFELQKIILILGIFTGIISYWLNPYNESTVFGIHIYAIATVTTGLVAYFLAYKKEYDPKVISQNLVFGFLIAVVGRIAYEGMYYDSSSHNLAPMEILIIFIVVSLSSIIGAKIGEIVKGD